MTKKSVVARLHQHEKYERLIAATKGMPALPTAVAHPCDETSLRGALEAADAGTIVPILVGPQEKIRNLAKSLGLNIKDVEIVDVPHSQAAAAKAVELVRTAKAELLMKGSLHSDELLGAVTKRDTGLRTARRISHVFVMDVPTHPETLFITDAAVNIAPDLIGEARYHTERHRSLCGSGIWHAQGRHSVSSGNGEPGFPRQSKRLRFAKWRTADRSPEENSMDRWRSTTPLVRRRHA